MDYPLIRIFDTTLRDGEQAPGYSMKTSEKVSLARQLELLGVDIMEVGFPAASPDDLEATKQISKIIKNAEVCALCRTLPQDIKIAWEGIQKAQKPRLHTFIATSEIHMQQKLKKTPQEVLELAVQGVKLCKSLCSRVDFSPEDAGRSDRDFLVRVIEAAIAEGADVINIPDTVGYNQPAEFKALIEYLIKNVQGSDRVIWSTHCHNDLGLAVANSLAGVEAGARQIECTINGIGERAGNASLEEVVMNLLVRQETYQCVTGVVSQQLIPTSELLQQITQKVQPNKAIVGSNAFAHEAGIHQDGILKDPSTYEIMTPQLVGADSHRLVLGKHSGRAALSNALYQLGYQVSAKELDSIFERFKQLADQKKSIESGDLRALLTKEPSFTRWELKSISVSTEGLVSTVNIELIDHQEQQTHAASHSSPGAIDAAIRAIRKITKDPYRLLEFSAHSLSKGVDAQVQVYLYVHDSEQQKFGGNGISTSVLHASVAAYLSIVNQSTEA